MPALRISYHASSWLSLNENVQEITQEQSAFCGINFYNPNAHSVWVQLFETDKTSTPVPGVDAPVDFFVISPGSHRRMVDAAFYLIFNKGISIACTKSFNGDDAPDNDIEGRVFFRMGDPFVNV